MQKQTLVWVILAVPMAAILALLYLNFFRGEPPAEVPKTLVVPSTDPVPVPEEQFPDHPVPVPPAETDVQSEPLPDLDASDAVITQELKPMMGDSSLSTYMADEDIIRKIVVTVDNLSRDSLAIEKRILKPVAGSLFVNEQDEVTTLSTDNYLRYTNLARSFESLDLIPLSDFYFEHYPLFQQAYEELGYPDGYFNDRLIETLDHLLAPMPSPDNIELTRPKGLYKYNNEELEALSTGQKILLRIGPDNAAIVRDKLEELRKLTARDEPKLDID